MTTNILVSGGKFANGAITAAFVQAFNGEKHRGSNRKFSKEQKETANKRLESAINLAKAEDIPYEQAIVNTYLNEFGAENDQAWYAIYVDKLILWESGSSYRWNYISAEHYLDSYFTVLNSSFPQTSAAVRKYITAPGYNLAKRILGNGAFNASPATEAQLYWGIKGADDALGLLED